MLAKRRAAVALAAIDGGVRRLNPNDMATPLVTIGLLESLVGDGDRKGFVRPVGDESSSGLCKKREQ